MKNILIILLLSFSPLLKAQYISEIIEYIPAPGQFTNTENTGSPGGAEKLVGGLNGLVSLGAYGGYIIFRFEKAVENDVNNPFGVDFSIFGNAYSNWSEPGAVYVMQDENENGLADDTWYLLAGSDYYFSSSKTDYSITYENPKAAQVDIPWTDNSGNSGVIPTNTFHKQEWYPTETHFPTVDRNSYTLGGFYLSELVDKANPGFVKLPQRAFGYADNNAKGTAPDTRPDNPYTTAKENSGGDAFDISWAVDANGNYVELDSIHFVKVQNAVNDDGGWAGEVSTEIRGAVDVAPDASVTGENRLVVMKDIFPSLTAYEGDTLFLEGFAFENGRLSDKAIQWYSDNIAFSIEENRYVVLEESGEVTFTLELQEEPDIKKSTTVSVTVEEVTSLAGFNASEIEIFPNPASDKVYLNNIPEAQVNIFATSGELVFQKTNCQAHELISVTDWNPGIYILEVVDNENATTQQKIIIQ